MSKYQIGDRVETHMGYGQYVEQVYVGPERGWWHTVRTWWDHDRARRERQQREGAS